MIFALDFDETYTAAPELWGPWIARAKYLGHSVSFVTFRFGHHHESNRDIHEEAIKHGIDIVFTGARQKRHVFPQADVWIDDMPELIPSYSQLKNMAMGCEVMSDTP